MTCSSPCSSPEYRDCCVRDAQSTLGPPKYSDVGVDIIRNNFGNPPERRPDLRRLDDYPEVEEAWLEYLADQWEPWAKEMRRWQEVQTVYENVDFMRRRLEEAEERYELVAIKREGREE